MFIDEHSHTRWLYTSQCIGLAYSLIGYSSISFDVVTITVSVSPQNAVFTSLKAKEFADTFSGETELIGESNP